MKKIRSSTKIAVGFAAIAALGWLAYTKVTDAMIMGEKFPPILPGRVNIVGVDPGAGYRIIVSNELAQLVETQGGFSANESDDSSSESSIKKRIPLSDLLQTLQGNSDALGRFVMTMNDMSDNDLPPHRVLWSKADLEKAFHGDKALRDKLESDLNMKLDGTPLPTLRIASLEDGIVIQLPVTIPVNLKGVTTPITGTVLQAYQPRMMKAVQADYAQDTNPTTTVKLGYYLQEAKKVLASPKTKENIQQDIENDISDSAVATLTETPKRILKSAFIVLNDGFIKDANYDTQTSSDGKPIYSLTIDLNDEGRRRLWQYSQRRVGDQLLVVSDGIAIAAPRIHSPLMLGEITVTSMRDQTILDSFKDTLTQAKQGTATASR